MKRGGFKG
jgi:hypothetical protein